MLCDGGRSPRISRYKHNPRICPAEAIEGVAASIRAFGWKVPLVVSRKGRIIAGHTRYEAALSLGLTEVPVIVADDLSKAQQRAYRIADNKLAEATSWDDDLLARELAALVGMEIDPALTGFSSDELAALLAPPPSEGLCDPDEAVEPPDEPLTKPGDLWLLGTHRLLCGDSTKAEDVRRLMGGQRAAADGHRSALSGRLHRRRPSLQYRQPRRDPARTSTGTPTSTTPTRSSSTATSCAWP